MNIAKDVLLVFMVFILVAAFSDAYIGSPLETGEENDLQPSSRLDRFFVTMKTERLMVSENSNNLLFSNIQESNIAGGNLIDSVEMQWEEFALFSLHNPSPSTLKALRSDPRVLNIENNKVFYASGNNDRTSKSLHLRGDPLLESSDIDFCHSPLYQWGLDRIDQKENALSCTPYLLGDQQISTDMANVTIYILDTGLQIDHEAFERADEIEVAEQPDSPNRTTSRIGARTVTLGQNFFPSTKASLTNNDLEGHGTHVASTAAGYSIGVASAASIIAVKTLDDDGSGTLDNFLAALKNILREKKHNPGKRMIVNMSIEGAFSTALNRAVDTVAKAGIPVIVAAGNRRSDACNVSPASAPAAVTVAAANVDGKFDTSYSNYGPCVDIVAPGTAILGACSALSSTVSCEGGSIYQYRDGTSMAAPHVAGVIALYMGAASSSEIGDPLSGGIGSSPTPEVVKALLTCTASAGRLDAVPTAADPDGSPTPNLMLQSPNVKKSKAVRKCLKAAHIDFLDIARAAKNSGTTVGDAITEATTIGTITAVAAAAAVRAASIIRSVILSTVAYTRASTV